MRCECSKQQQMKTASERLQTSPADTVTVIIKRPAV